MTTRMIDCNDCGASVPYGRLSCPRCGALLASVTGGRPVAARIDDRLRAPVVAAVAALDADADADAETGSPGPIPAATYLLPDEPISGATYLLPDESTHLHAVPFGPVSADEDEVPVAALPAGAYRPPAFLLSAATVAGRPASPDVPAPADDGVGLLSAVLDPVRFAEIAGWFVVVGATMAVLGLLLPWTNVVIGPRGLASYFDAWGLAGPGYVLVLCATLIVLALGIVRTPIPVWVKSGVVPLALGSLLMGLAWPLQFGPTGGEIGVLVVALGAFALVIGGVVATWATRHVEEGPVV